MLYNLNLIFISEIRQRRETRRSPSSNGFLLRQFRQTQKFVGSVRFAGLNAGTKHRFCLQVSDCSPTTRRSQGRDDLDGLLLWTDFVWPYSKFFHNFLFFFLNTPCGKIPFSLLYIGFIIIQSRNLGISIF